MFGHDNQGQHTDNHPAPDGSLAQSDMGASDAQLNDTAGDFLDDVASPSTPPAVTQPSTDASGGVNLPTPTDDDTVDSTVAPVATAPTTATPNTDQLLEIKQQALQQLTPLIGHLEQNPEEKFRTTMMMIQAADNHELIQTAYEAAQQIPDEKVRAQALLDIVNEINYFTHNSSESAAA